MLFRGTLIGPASGKLAGVVASHNRGGQYFRQHVIPTDPFTEQQQAMREAMSYAAERWANFTDEDRRAWDAYARSKPMPNRLGDDHHATGRNMHARLCTFRRYCIQWLDLSCSLDDYAPTNTIEQFDAIPSVSLDSNSSPTALVINWPGDMGWLEYDSSFMAVFVSTPRPGTVNWFRGPWPLRSAIVGNDDPVPSPPFTIPLPDGCIPAYTQSIFVKLRLSRQLCDLNPPFFYRVHRPI